MKPRIEFGAFQASDKIRLSVNKCLDSGWLTMGPAVREFEEKWRNLFNYPYARALSNGTAADTACCMSLYELVGAKKGDEVICPALSFIASYNAIRAAGLKPVFVDVELETLQIQIDKIEAAITSRTKAIMAVNLMGRLCDLDILQEICQRRNLVLIADNCEAYGGRLRGKYSLEYADMETSSHFNAHIIFSVEQGMVSSRFNEMDTVIESVRSHGRLGGKDYFEHPIWGLNFKPNDLCASVGLVGLDDFWATFVTRKGMLSFMREACLGQEDKAYFVEEGKERINAPHAFSVVCKQEKAIDKLKEKLDEENIAWKRNFVAPTQSKAFDYLGLHLGDFPNAEYIANNGIHIGCHQYLSGTDLARICDTLTSFFKEI